MQLLGIHISLEEADVLTNRSVEIFYVGLPADLTKYVAVVFGCDQFIRCRT